MTTVLRPDALKERIRQLLRHENSEVADRDLIAWLYQVLTVLDTKASALLRLNGIFIAAVFVLLSLASQPPGQVDVCAPLLGLSFILFLASSCFCYFVVRIKWDFLAHANARPEGGFDFTKEIDELAVVVFDRTRYYRFAWRPTPFAIIILVVAGVPAFLELLESSGGPG